jgi:hypothetical protein
MKRPILISNDRIRMELKRCRELLIQYPDGKIAQTLRDIERELLKNIPPLKK